MSESQVFDFLRSTVGPAEGLRDSINRLYLEDEERVVLRLLDAAKLDEAAAERVNATAVRLVREVRNRRAEQAQRANEQHVDDGHPDVGSRRRGVGRKGREGE